MTTMTKENFRVEILMKKTRVGWETGNTAIFVVVLFGLSVNIRVRQNLCSENGSSMIMKKKE